MTEIIVNDCIVARVYFSITQSDPRDHIIRVPRPCIKEDGKVKISFQNLSPVSPKELGFSDDTRRLGIGVVSFSLQYAQTTTK